MNELPTTAAMVKLNNPGGHIAKRHQFPWDFQIRICPEICITESAKSAIRMQIPELPQHCRFYAN